MFLIAMIVVGSLWMWSAKFKDTPVTVAGFTVPDKVVVFFLGVGMFPEAYHLFTPS